MLIKMKKVREFVVNKGATNRNKGKKQMEHKKTIPIIRIKRAAIIFFLKVKIVDVI